MTFNGWLQIILYFLLVLAVTVPMGAYMFRVFERKRTWLDPVLRPVERGIYAVCGVDETREQRWTGFAVSVLIFSILGLLFTYALLRLQENLPLNPEGFPGVRQDTAFNTAVSFTTNTNWQAYGGESTMSYLSQMMGLAIHNFFSAAIGIAIAIAVIRGFARRSVNELGNFWVDLVRCTLWILLPICFVGALVLVSQGAIQNFRGYVDVTTLEGATQRVPMGPASSQEFIKMLGTNGGGFFNANSAHPLSSPSPFTNLLEMVAIFAIPAGLTYTFGLMVGDRRQGWVLFAAMSAIFLAGVLVVYWSESAGNPIVNALGIGSNGNWEGKEVRFGIPVSSLFTVITTAASCGAVNSFIDSYTPIGGLVPMINIQLGEIVFGGVGSGFYGILIFAILSVFIAGLMVGRTPEYLGKKIQAREVKLAMLAVLVLEALILGLSGLASVTRVATEEITNPGPHGLSQMLYAFSSGTGNNGSAFGGLGVNTIFYNMLIGAAMWFGRYFVIIPVLALAGSLAAKRRAEATAGTFPTHTPLFAGLLVGVIVIVGALTFFPAYSLAPIVEQLQMRDGVTYSP
jgi:potassium-transporting ATPase potassium-binding subunit